MPPHRSGGARGPLRSRSRRVATVYASVARSLGGTVEAAVWWFISMECCCQVQFLAESIGTPLLVGPVEARATNAVNGTPVAVVGS
jgi:hypothetical protein